MRQVQIEIQMASKNAQHVLYTFLPWTPWAMILPMSSQVHINPELRIAELNYANNAASCQLQYTGFQVVLSNCTLGLGP